MTSVFAKYTDKVYKNRYSVSLLVHEIHGGIPSDAKKAEGWIKAALGEATDDQLKRMVSETLAERAVGEITEAAIDDAIQEAMDLRTLNGFKRIEGDVVIEGRQVKAMVKEAANIRWAKDRWGETRKGTRSFFAEHVFVPEKFISLGVTEPTGISQNFVHTWRGSAISYEEFVLDAKCSFTVVTDFDFSDKQWGELWVTAEHQGLGASRSRGHGTFEVVAWDKM